MSRDDALVFLTKQPTDPPKEWLTPERHRASMVQAYDDMDAAVGEVSAAAQVADGKAAAAQAAAQVADGKAAAAAAAAQVADGKAVAAQEKADQVGVVAAAALPRGVFAEPATADDVVTAASVTITTGQQFPPRSKPGDLHQNIEARWGVYSDPDGRADAGVVFDTVNADGVRTTFQAVAIMRDGKLWAGALTDRVTTPVPDGTPLLDARFANIQSVVDTPLGVYFCDNAHKRVYRVDNGRVFTVATGSFRGVAVHDGEVYACGPHRVVRLTGNGETIIAGDDTNQNQPGDLPGKLRAPYHLADHPDGFAVAHRTDDDGHAVSLINLTDNTLTQIATLPIKEAVYRLTTNPETRAATPTITAELADGKRYTLALTDVPQMWIQTGTSRGWEPVALGDDVQRLIGMIDAAQKTADLALPKSGGTVTGEVRVTTGDVRVGGTVVRNTPISAVALGWCAQEQASGNVAVALGWYAQQYASGSGAVALGAYAQQYASGINSVAAGPYAQQYVSGRNSIAFGQYAQRYASETDAISIGNLVSTRRGADIATSTTSHDLTTSPLEAGRNYRIDGVGVVITTPDGTTSHANARAWTSTGTETSIVATSGLRIFPYLSVGARSVAIGEQAHAEADDAIAIGAGAYAATTETVQIGKPGTHQKIRVGSNELVNVTELRAVVNSATDWADFKTKIDQL